MAEVEFTHKIGSSTFSVYASGVVYQDYPAERMICDLLWVKAFRLHPDGSEKRLDQALYHKIISQFEEAAVELLYAAEEMDRHG